MQTRLLVLAAACVAAACSSPGAAVSSLTRLTQVSSSTQCPGGGVVIATGLDDNGNGTLDDAEVKDTQEVCNGAAGNNGQPGTNGVPGARGDGGFNGLGGLILTTPLPAGDANCPEGGVRIEVGLDDGSNGGTAGNGTLETGEIEATRHICNGAGNRLFPGSVTPPVSPAGASVINANGGTGSSMGGYAGFINVVSRWGTRGGHVKVFKTGVADAAFAVGTLPAFVPGSQPYSATTNTTINSYADVAAGLASANPVFLVDLDERLWANVGGAAVQVTSISVAAGVTLTFDSNFGDLVRVVVQKDVRNAGTLKRVTVSDGISFAELRLDSSNFYGEPGSSIDTKGLAGGGTGGPVALFTGALLVNQGTIDTSGGDGTTTGGLGGGVSFLCNPGSVTNTGAITTRGGTASAGTGGPGGVVIFHSGYRALRNSGAIISSGGAGTLGGGEAGGVELDPDGLGSVLNSGNITATGGACTGVDCNGGHGAQVKFEVMGGELRNSGNIDSSGGAGVGLGNGGNGGRIEARLTDFSSNLAGGLDMPAGSAFVSGNLTNNGGVGGTGGDAGSVHFELNVLNLGVGQELTLLGYTQINANGGAGPNGTGRPGGYLRIKNTNDEEDEDFEFDEFGPPVGATLNYADVSLKGGDGQTAGTGGVFIMTANAGTNHGNPWEYAANFAATVDVRGGTGSTVSGGAGGQVSIYGQARAESHAAVNGNGGNASSPPTVHSGAGGFFELGSDLGPVVNTGSIQLNSGTSSGIADAAGEAWLGGTAVTNSGNISCNGGNATLNGGSGGYVELLSTPLGASTNTGTLSVSGGSGSTPGNKGSAVIDGNDVTP